MPFIILKLSLINLRSFNFPVPIVLFLKNMYRLKSSLLSFSVLFFVSCNSADSKIPAMAADMCGCFDKLKSGISTEAAAVFDKVKNSPDPQKTLQEEIVKLKPEEAQELAATLSQMGNSGSEIGQCMQAIDKKYGAETTTDKKALLEKIASEMKKNNQCAVGAAIISIGAKNSK